MPPKRRSNLSRTTQHAKRMSLARQQETEEENELRLADQRFRSSMYRDSESQDQREERLRNNHVRTMKHRRGETEERQEERLSTQKLRTSSQREQETAEQREQRLARQQLRSIAQREQETVEQQKQRLATQQLRSIAQRQQETVEQEDQRLAMQQLRSISYREQETKIQKEQRLADQHVRSALKQEEETPREYEERLERQRVRSTNLRNNESHYERVRRLATMQTHSAAIRQSESRNEYEERLKQKRQKARVKREKESPEENSARLAKQRTRTASRRAAPADSYFSIPQAAFNYQAELDYKNEKTIVIGEMSEKCRYCSARKFKGETAGLCCSSGKIKIPQIPSPPQPLQSLMLGKSNESSNFLSQLRQYNSAFQMTSFGASREVFERGFMPTFKVQGQVYHLIGSIRPDQTEQHKFLQVYFMEDSNEQCNRRCELFDNLSRETVFLLQEMLHCHHQLVKQLKTAIEQENSDSFNIVIRADKRPIGEHARRFNAPAASEVAILLVGDASASRRDIQIQNRDNTLKRVSETHRSYDALQYPLIFWQGQDGYCINIPQVDPRTGSPVASKKVSACDFYAYLIMVRENDCNHLLRCQSLFHQFLVDMYAKIEGERLLYIRQNQTKLRVENYVHLRDAVLADGNLQDLGQLVILPSSFTGGPRYMHERTQDAMAYVRAYGRPDLFITLTCNPQWQEITRELFQGQKAIHRHDLIARVFRQKVIKLVNLVTKHAIFGEARCFMYTIEWQKRGLPHVHLLLWLKTKIHSEQIDSIISAELPNPEADPILFEAVKSHMVHGPCGVFNRKSPCMADGRCTKRFPKQFLDATQAGQDGYPLYRRRKPGQGGFQALIKVHSKQEVEIDNRWIVPYSPLLLKIFEAHINIEFCHSVKSIKYVCKYINKGSDMAMMALQDEKKMDEISRFQMARYISTNEAVWRILNFPLHERFPTDVHLDVHLENGQRIYYNHEDTTNIREQLLNPKKTTLTAFFELCQLDDFARTLLYQDVPQFYTWQQSKREWKRRVLGQPVEGHEDIKRDCALGRVYTVHPKNFECYYLRLLLHSVRGPKSFKELRTMHGNLCATYREACQKRGLLEDDNHWSMALREAALTSTSPQLRSLFGIMLINCELSNPQALWDQHKEHFCEDLRHQLQVNHSSYVVQDDQADQAVFNRALCLIEEKVLSIGGKLLQEYGINPPQRSGHQFPLDMTRESSYDMESLTRQIQENEPKLLDEQRAVYNKVLSAVLDDSEGMFFLDAPGGTGKTFLINLLLAKVRQLGHIAIAVASSGIAATLLSGGRTAHSAFKLPLNLVQSENAVCNIARQSDMAKVLRQTKLIVWDECTMAHKHGLEALNRTLQDLRQSELIMGGVILLLAGDFRQTLPVIPKGTKADELAACLKASFLWRHVQKLKLTTNMRVRLTGIEDSAHFASDILEIGNGIIPFNQEVQMHQLPCGQMVSNLSDLKSRVFPSLESNYMNIRWLYERAILAPKNEAVEKLNNDLQRQLPGTEQTFQSINTVINQDQAVEFPTEFLNSLQPPGLPPHLFRLKQGSPIMLLRNLDPPKLCNGTRLIVKSLGTNVIEATIITGSFAGEDVFIPRIPLITSDLPFEFRRLQFPVRLAFAMTINKAQGQSLSVVGLNLDTSCFSHGQLYVGCSRVGSGDNLFIFSSKKGFTQNVVYKEVLQN